MTTARIAGIGTFLPAERRTNDWFPEPRKREKREKQDTPTVTAQDRTFNDIRLPADPREAEIIAKFAHIEADRFLGAKVRYAAPYGTVKAHYASAMAANVAIREAGIDPLDIDFVLEHALCPDGLPMSEAGAVAHLVGAKNAAAYGVECACASAVAQLQMARMLILSGEAKIVLCTQSHLMTRTSAPDHPALPGIGDGAAAYVVMADRGYLEIQKPFAITHGEFWNAVLFVRGAATGQEPPWYLEGGDFRAGSHDHQGVKYLMQHTVAFGADSIRQAAKNAGIDVAQIDVIASVMPRGYIPGATAETLGLKYEQAVCMYEEVGHLGASGIAFNLLRARERGLLTPGAHVAVFGQGSGFTRAAAILKVV